MIDKLNIEGYKSIADAIIPLKALNVLAGLNSSGKSSVIQTIRILERVAHHKETLLIEGGGDENVIRNRNCESLNLNATCVNNGEESSITYPPVNDEKCDFPKVIYISADRFGPQLYYPTRPDYQLGAQGENVMKCIDYYNDITTREENNNLLANLAADDHNIGAFRFVVQGWLSQITPNVILKINTVKEIDANVVQFNDCRATNVGYGLSYGLPVIVAVLMGVLEPNSIVLLENPEAHIHPKGQTAMGRLIAQAVDAGAQIVVETHSDHLFDGIRIYAKNHPGFARKVNTIWFRLENEETHIEIPLMDDNGRLDKWPEDMFDQFTINSSELI
jgi:predicted ATPase